MKRFLLRLLALFILLSLSCQAITPVGTPTNQPPTQVPPTPPRSTSTPLAVPTALPTTAAQVATPTAAATELSIPPEQLSAGDPYIPEIGNRGYDVSWYALDLTLDPQQPGLDAQVIITATTTEDISALSLDFVGFEIDAVTVDEVPAVYQRLNKKLLVALPQPLAASSTFQLDVAYHGQPEKIASRYVPFVPSLGLFYVPDANGLFVAAEPDGARNWFPCNDHPSDKAAYRFNLNVPYGLTAVANGVLVESTTSYAGNYFTWVHSQPLATAFVTVAVGKYERIESLSPQGVPIRSYLRSEQVVAYHAKEAAIGEMIDWLGAMFGPYPFDEFGYVSVPSLGASLETQTMVLLGTEDFFEGILIHEMAHMWFGDWVSLDSWGEIWRSEGFATYLVALWSNRDDPTAFENDIATMAQSMQDYPATFPLNDPPPHEMFGQQTYYGAAVVIHALRQTVGDEAFFTGLRLYFERYGGGSASDADFQAVLEEAAGLSLDEFFASWFKEP